MRALSWSSSLWTGACGELAAGVGEFLFAFAELLLEVFALAEAGHRRGWRCGTPRHRKRVVIGGPCEFILALAQLLLELVALPEQFGDAVAARPRGRRRRVC